MSLTDFLYWHYVKCTKEILKAWGNFIGFAMHLFSVSLLFKTLFSPWHRVAIGQGSPGFSFQKFFEQLSFNLISRGIGFFVRSIFIFLGLITALIFGLLGFPLLFIWLLIPFITCLFYYQNLMSKDDQTKLSGKAKEFVFQRLGISSDTDLTKINSQDKNEVWLWYLKIKKQRLKSKRFWEKDNLYKFPSFGSSLAYGFTNELDEYVTDMSFPPPFSHHLVSREREIKQIESALVKSEANNVLLVGEPGVGKQTILLGFAKAIKEKRTRPEFFYHRVLKLNMNSIVGQSPVLGEVKARFETILKEAQAAGNIIIVIDEIDKYLSNQVIDLTTVITHLLQTAKIKIIGVTTPTNFERYLFPNAQIIKYFEKVEIVPPSQEEALKIIEEILPDFEKNKKVIVTYQALREIIQQSDRLITNIPFPEKAIDIIDKAITEANKSGKLFLTEADADTVISESTKIPIGALSANEADKLKNFTTLIHKYLVDQVDATTALAQAFKRARLAISETNKPIGSFLFLGPTGVGKTETAKAVAESFFGNKNRMIRFDMAQYQDETGINALIGSSVTDKPGLLVKEVREAPYGVLLLDEFEKANKEILNLFLTVFDEAYLKDPQGKNVSFKNMIIICTSNAAAELIREQVSKNLPFEKLQTMVIEFILKQGIFSPELINRFDGIIVYKPLSSEDVGVIARHLLEDLAERMALKEIKLSLDPAAISLVAKLGHSNEFGARPMKRLIANQIESLIADLILDNKIGKGDEIKLTLDSIKEKFKIECVGKKLQ